MVFLSLALVLTGTPKAPTDESLSAKQKSGQLEKALLRLLQTEGCIDDSRLPLIQVRRLEGPKLVEPLVAWRSDGKYDCVLRAEEAELSVDSGKCQLLLHLKNGLFFSAGSSVRVQEKTIVLDLPASFQKDVEELHRAAATKVLSVDEKLGAAFGKNCEELKRLMRLDLRTKGLVVAADSLDILPDGSVKWAPCSLVVYRRNQESSETRPLSSFRTEHATMTLDRPISSATELGQRKIVAIHLAGGLKLKFDE
jgi:hypothetical protein